jgi:hypothetical protein
MIENIEWPTLINRRLLLADAMTGVRRWELTLLELSPNGEYGKFRNEIAKTQFWDNLGELEVLDILR